MTAYLTVTHGHEPAKQYVLDPDQDYRIGRGAGCQIPLSDPLSSRVHALLVCRQGSWYISDAASRNGTLVNGQKIDEALLISGSVVRIGSTDLRFSSDDPEHASSDPIALTQTLVFDASVVGEATNFTAFSALRDKKRVQDLLDLYQLSIQLLGSEEPERVSELAVELLRVRTQATFVGFLWLDEAGRLRPSKSEPPEADGKVRLSRKLTEMVIKNAKAIWFKNQREVEDHSLKNIADALCVPLLHDSKPIGAIHLYRENGDFREHDFEFAISASNILSMALVRARRQAMLQVANERLVARNADFDELLGNSTPMQTLKERITRVARASGCVLIRGESGSGKELVARAIHRSSPRADRPMLSVNCAAIPAELMESQLFGHKKGAFTGADADHPGWFQQAHTGTLFLDEVGELTLEGQAKLLRILEGHPFLPVGSKQEVRVDVRVLAATNRDLREFVREKRFREDLYYRLGVFELNIPPLRERGADVEMLVEHFFDHFRRQHGRQKLQLSDEAKRKLVEYAWPGNVRQLRNVIDSAVVMAVDEEIRSSDLGLRDVGEERFDSLLLADWERKLITEALKRADGKVPEAAKLLGISRATLYRKLEEYGIAR